MRVTFRGTALHDIGHLFLTDGFEHLSPELPAPAPYRPEVRSEVADRSAIRRCRLMPSAKLSPRALPSPTRRNRAQLTVRRFRSQPRGTLPIGGLDGPRAVERAEVHADSGVVG